MTTRDPSPPGAAPQSSGAEAGPARPPRARRALRRLLEGIGSCFMTDGTYLPMAIVPPWGTSGRWTGPGRGPR
jgi:hypothetical protein